MKIRSFLTCIIPFLPLAIFLDVLVMILLQDIERKHKIRPGKFCPRVQEMHSVGS